MESTLRSDPCSVTKSHYGIARVERGLGSRGGEQEEEEEERMKE